MASKQTRNIRSLLEGRDTFYPIYKRLMKLLDTRSVVRLSQASKTIRAMTLSHSWNINIPFRHHFRDPRAFRSVLGECNALIAGSWVVQFLLRQLSKNEGILIFVQRGDNADKMEHYLSQKESYDVPASPDATREIELAPPDKAGSLSAPHYNICAPCRNDIGNVSIHRLDVFHYLEQDPTTPTSVLEFSGFNVIPPPPPPQYSRSAWVTWDTYSRSFLYRIWVEDFRRPSLKYRYTGGPITQLSRILRANALAQLAYKLDDNSRGRLIGDYSPAAASLRELPVEEVPGWDFWDDEIPKLFLDMGLDQ
ncbi:hypothetical protein TruAng_010691 [Truncatella angustata]|nr:hypothetical protein TruAng_010691 [Truncatella angustata]